MGTITAGILTGGLYLSDKRLGEGGTQTLIVDNISTDCSKFQ
jgi:hypothetical protein